MFVMYILSVLCQFSFVDCFWFAYPVPVPTANIEPVTKTVAEVIFVLEPEPYEESDQVCESAPKSVEEGIFVEYDGMEWNDVWILWLCLSPSSSRLHLGCSLPRLQWGLSSLWLHRGSSSLRLCLGQLLCLCHGHPGLCLRLGPSPTSGSSFPSALPWSSVPLALPLSFGQV